MGNDGEADLATSGVTVRCLHRADGSMPASQDEPDLVAYVARSYSDRWRDPSGSPPVSPMLAKLTRELPSATSSTSRSGTASAPSCSATATTSRSEPERAPARHATSPSWSSRFASLPERAVVDGEIVIATEHGLDFDLLSLRIHPAASRVEMLAAETPSSFVAFDLLAEGDDDLRGAPFAKRRARLERSFEKAQAAGALTPATTDRALAGEWFDALRGRGPRRCGREAARR